MAKCAICEKTSGRSWRVIKLRGKFNPTAKRRRYANLQWVRLPENKAGLVKGERVKACAKCIKAIGKQK